MAGIVTKVQMGYEDLSIGTSTFARANSTGGTQTLHQIPLPSQSIPLVDLSTAQVLTNKTLTAPIVTNPSTTGTDSGAETLQNKTLTAPIITNPSTTGTDSGAETLVNKTLTAPIVTNPSTTGTDSGAETLQNKTIIRGLAGGTTQVNGNFALSAGWGSTPTVSVFASSKDGAGRVSITPGGSGIAANPTVTMTFADGAYPRIPACFVSVETNGQGLGVIIISNPSTTVCGWQFLATPTTGVAYIFDWIVAPF